MTALEGAGIIPGAFFIYIREKLIREKRRSMRTFQAPHPLYIVEEIQDELRFQ